MSTPINRPSPVQSDRNTDGLPKGLEQETEWPGNWAQINGGGPPGSAAAAAGAKIDQSHSNNRNDHLPYLIGAWATASVALTLCVVGWLVGPRLIRAEVRADYADELAAVQEQAKQARQDAAIAKDWTDQKNAELKILRGNTR